MESQEVLSCVFNSTAQLDDDSQEITLPSSNLIVEDTPERKDSSWKNMKDDICFQRLKRSKITKM